MKFSIDVKSVLDEVSAAGEFTSRLGSMSASGCVRLSCDGNGSLSVSTYDGKTWFNSKIKTFAEDEQEGSAVVPCGKLASLLLANKGGEAVFTDEDSKLLVKIGRQRTKFASMTTEFNFDAPSVRPEWSASFNAPDLKAALAKNVVSVSDPRSDVRNPIFTTVWISKCADGGATLVSSDGRNLVRSFVPASIADGFLQTGVFPKELDAICKGDGESVLIACDGKLAYMKCGRREITTPVFSEKTGERFPDWTRLVENAARTKVTSVERAALADAMKRVSPMSDKMSKSVKIEAAGDLAVVSAEDAEAIESSVEIDLEQGSAQVDFKTPIEPLRSFLIACEGDKASFEWEDVSKAFLVRADDESLMLFIPQQDL